MVLLTTLLGLPTGPRPPPRARPLPLPLLLILFPGVLQVIFHVLFLVFFTPIGRMVTVSQFLQRYLCFLCTNPSLCSRVDLHLGQRYPMGFPHASAFFPVLVIYYYLFTLGYADGAFILSSGTPILSKGAFILPVRLPSILGGLVMGLVYSCWFLGNFLTVPYLPEIFLSTIPHILILVNTAVNRVIKITDKVLTLSTVCVTL